MNVPSATARASGAIVVCGGYDGEATVRSCESYSIASDRWSSIASMGRARRDFALVEWRGRLFAIGGNPPTDTIEELRGNRWLDSTATLLSTREAFGTVVYGT